MTEENEGLAGSHGDPQPNAKQIKISMQQGEHSGQPIYSNLASAQSLPGGVIVDFGFLDPQNVQTLNRQVKAGNKTAPNVIDARMSCRMVLSSDAAAQLSRQLHQLMAGRKEKAPQAVTEQPSDASQAAEQAPSNNAPSNAENKNAESGKSGFRFPWSKKSN